MPLPFREDLQPISEFFNLPIGNLFFGGEFESITNYVEDFFKNSLPKILSSNGSKVILSDEVELYVRTDCSFEASLWKMLEAVEEDEHGWSSYELIKELMKIALKLPNVKEIVGEWGPTSFNCGEPDLVIDTMIDSAITGKWTIPLELAPLIKKWVDEPGSWVWHSFSFLVNEWLRQNDLEELKFSEKEKASFNMYEDHRASQRQNLIG